MRWQSCNLHQEQSWKIKDHNVTVHVLFGCFLILQAYVLRSLEFKGGEAFLWFWINRIGELSTTTKSMDNVINYEIDCRKCLNGCPFATKTNTFLSKDDGEYHGIINNFMNRWIHYLTEVDLTACFLVTHQKSLGKGEEEKFSFSQLAEVHFGRKSKRLGRQSSMSSLLYSNSLSSSNSLTS